MATKVNTGVFGKYSLTDPGAILMGLVGATLGIAFLVVALIFGVNVAMGGLEWIQDVSGVDVPTSTDAQGGGVNVEVV